MTAKRVLEEAAGRIELKGWCQGSYGKMAEGVAAERGKQRPGRGVPAGSPCGALGNLMGTPVAETCIVGALRQVGGDDPGVELAKAKLHKFLHVDNLADWNDEDGRTKDEVIEALRNAAKSS